MKVLLVCAAVPLVFAFQAPRTAVRLSSLGSVAPLRQADELVQKADQCIGEGCEVDEMLRIRRDMEDTLMAYDDTIETYADVEDAPDATKHVSGAEVEEHALRKYIQNIRNLHTTIADKLTDLDSLLLKARTCSDNRKQQHRQQQQQQASS